MTCAAPAIVGAGPAGCAAAIRLLQAGQRPLLIERRPAGGDALCGGFLSWRTLDRLEALGISRGELGGHPVTTLRMVAGNKVRTVALPALGMGLSRRRLDTLMLDRAEHLGASILRATARYVDGRLRLDGGDPVECGSLFLATGKHDLRGLARPRDAAGADPMMGLRLRVKPSVSLWNRLAGHIELHLFAGGYAGVVLQEGDSANICMAVRKSRLAAAGGKPLALLAELAAQNRYFGERLMDLTPDPAFDAVAHVPYGWRAKTGEAGVFRLGDQAGVIPSLAGEGIGIALASADEAVRFWRAGGAATGPTFQRSLSGMLRRPLAAAGAVAKLGEGRGAGLMVALAGIPGAASGVAEATRL